MILHIWALGILFTISVFAIKVGLGLGMYPADSKRKILVLSLYWAVFLGIGMLVERINLLDYFSFFQQFLSYGMIIHIALASGMILWGFYVLNKLPNIAENKEGQEVIISQSVWMILLPCPVCLTAILLTISLGAGVSGYSGLLIGAVLGAIFDLIAGITILASKWEENKTRSRNRTNPNFRLAVLMLGIGSYFFLSILVIPVYQQTKHIYNMALDQGGQLDNPERITVFILLAILLFILGIVRKRKEMSR
jgi:predicted transporter